MNKEILVPLEMAVAAHQEILSDGALSGPQALAQAGFGVYHRTTAYKRALKLLMEIML